MYSEILTHKNLLTLLIDVLKIYVSEKQVSQDSAQKDIDFF